MKNLGYLFAAYTFIWIAILAYVYILAQRQRNLEREIKTLRQIWERKINGSE
jgi:CcmD family protein